ncbi:MAG: nucleoside monophosphate kinase [Patescibacteria group bacterium]
MDLVLFGIQGSGKGTQARVLVERFDMAYFETGAQLRALAQETSPLGEKVRSIIDAGHLVPNEVVMEIIESFLSKLNSTGSDKNTSVLFDGIPRQREQAASFDDVMAKFGREFRCIVLDLSRAKAEERLLTRRMCTVCKKIYSAMYTGSTCECGGQLVTRKDDNAESIRTRLEVFENETLPVLAAYEEHGVLLRVNGDQPIDVVTKELLVTIQNADIHV